VSDPEALASRRTRTAGFHVAGTKPHRHYSAVPPLEPPAQGRQDRSRRGRSATMFNPHRHIPSPRFDLFAFSRHGLSTRAAGAARMGTRSTYTGPLPSAAAAAEYRARESPVGHIYRRERSSSLTARRELPSALPTSGASPAPVQRQLPRPGARERPAGPGPGLDSGLGVPPRCPPGGGTWPSRKKAPGAGQPEARPARVVGDQYILEPAPNLGAGHWLLFG
jgi:hypothetical protein